VAPIRIIPRLDVKGSNVVKGIQFEGLRVVGKPGELARKYYNEGADEMLFMDIVASLYGRNNILSVVEEAAREIFVPMTVGGGIRTLDDIVAVLRSGADKVAINTAAITRPDFLREAANTFGSQCIVLSIEAKRQPGGLWEAYTDNGRERTGREVMDWVSQAVDLGVGEILVTSVDCEGQRKGFDMVLISEIRRRVSVPVIAGGGAGSADHVIGLATQGHADAVCCASIFHYGTCTLPQLKQSLSESGIEVRP
jgi:cyclase